VRNSLVLKQDEQPGCQKTRMRVALDVGASTSMAAPLKSLYSASGLAHGKALVRHAAIANHDDGAAFSTLRLIN
jgi:hypothetical protein